MQFIPYILNCDYNDIDNQESDVKSPMAVPNRSSSRRGCSCVFDSRNFVKSIPVDARHLLTFRSKRVARVVSVTASTLFFSNRATTS